MGMKRPIERLPRMVEEVEKHEWFQEFAEVGGAHQSHNRAVRSAARSRASMDPLI
jgi:hypothetical protein